MAEIKERTRQLATVLADGFTIGDAGTGAFSEGVFEKSLTGTGLDIDQFQKAVRHIGNVSAAGSLVVAEAAHDYMQQNSGVDIVSATLPAVKGLKFDFDVYREAQVPNGDKNNPGMTTTWGRVTGKVILAGAGDRGEHKNVRDNVRAMFRETFGTEK